MLGTIVNTLAVIVGSTLGLIFRRGIPERISDAMMKGLGICTIFIGIDGAFQGENTLVMILSMVIGIVIGEGIDIDRHVNSAVMALENRFIKKKDNQQHTISEGIIDRKSVV